MGLGSPHVNGWDPQKSHQFPTRGAVLERNYTDTTIFVKNGPSYAGVGLGGEGFGTYSIAGPTGEGLTSPRTFTRQRRCVLVDYFRIT